MRVSGLNDITVDGDTIRISNTVGLFLQMGLTLDIVYRDNTVLAYEQR